MPVTLYFAILEFSCPEIVFLSLPQRLPDGLVTSSLVLILISAIFTIFTLRECFILCYQQIMHIHGCLARSALREHFHKVLRETLQQLYIVLKETLYRLYLALRELLHWTYHMLTFNATCRQFVGFTTIPASTIDMIYANATLFFDTDSSFWVCNNLATGQIYAMTSHYFQKSLLLQFIWLVQ